MLDRRITDEERVAAHDAWALELLAQRPVAIPRVAEDDVWNSSPLMALAAKHGGRCWYCGCELTRPTGDSRIGTAATREHLLPRARGGSNKAENIVAACRHCNITKQAKTVDEYRAALSRGRGGVEIIFHGERHA